jgi:hypothetical protein
MVTGGTPANLPAVVLTGQFARWSYGGLIEVIEEPKDARDQPEAEELLDEARDGRR